MLGRRVWFSRVSVRGSDLALYSAGPMLTLAAPRYSAGRIVTLAAPRYSAGPTLTSST
jgi:hypothetical protein